MCAEREENILRAVTIIKKACFSAGFTFGTTVLVLQCRISVQVSAPLGQEVKHTTSNDAPWELQ